VKYLTTTKQKFTKNNDDDDDDDDNVVINIKSLILQSDNIIMFMKISINLIL